MNPTEMYTVEELKTSLEFLFGFALPEDLRTFRQRVAYYVRKGMVPAPIRIPRPDGKPGRVGMYSADAFVKLERILRERGSKGKTRQRLSKIPDEQGRPHRLFSVSFWLPEVLAARVEGMSKAGFPLSRQLLIGFDLMHWADTGVREAVFNLILKHYGGDRPGQQLSDERLYYTCSLVVANHLLERLRPISQELGVPWDTLLEKYRFHFKVSEGHVSLESASRLNEKGEWEPITLKGTGYVEVGDGRDA